MRYLIKDAETIYDYEIEGVHKINSEIFEKGLTEYEIVDKDDEIDNLLGWIWEATGDKSAMRDDLVELIKGSSAYVLSSVSCNCYLGVSDKRNVEWFEKETDKILTINKNYETNTIHKENV